MRHLLTTAALLAALTANAMSISQASAQPVTDLERALDDALGEDAELPADQDQAALVTPIEEPAFTIDEIDALVAPYALYPNQLLAQVLVAATFPLQIVKADRIFQTGSPA